MRSEYDEEEEGEEEEEGALQFDTFVVTTCLPWTSSSSSTTALPPSSEGPSASVGVCLVYHHITFRGQVDGRVDGWATDRHNVLLSPVAGIPNRNARDMANGCKIVVFGRSGAAGSVR